MIINISNFWNTKLRPVSKIYNPILKNAIDIYLNQLLSFPLAVTKPSMFSERFGIWLYKPLILLQSITFSFKLSKWLTKSFFFIPL